MKTRLDCDTEILLNNSKNEKVIFDLYINGKKQTKRISTEILKIDENNQYGQAMTKSLQYGCIYKQEHPPSLTEVNRILDKISHDNNIGHLFIADIKFHDINCKTLFFNEIYPPTFEKYKKMEPFEQLILELIITVRNEGKDKVNSFLQTLKTH